MLPQQTPNFDQVIKDVNMTIKTTNINLDDISINNPKINDITTDLNLDDVIPNNVKMNDIMDDVDDVTTKELMTFLQSLTPAGVNKSRKCNVCGENFTRNENLKLYMMLHSEDRPHACNICGNRFKLEHPLMLHMKVHSENNINKCDVCGERLQSTGELKKHIKEHGEINKQYRRW